MAAKGTRAVSRSEKTVLKAFGARIARIRQRKGLSVYDVTGDDLPVKSRQHWQQIEAGQKNINLTTAFKVAKSLGVKPEELVAGIGF